MPVYKDREDFTRRGPSSPWIDVEDVEFILLGGADRVADGEEPPRSNLPDPLTEAAASFRAGLDVPSARRLVPAAERERIIVISGEVSYESGHGRVTLRRRDWIDIPRSGATIRNAMVADASGHRPEVELARFTGHWKEAIRTSIFKLGPGRPADYHYHDSDEYWFVFRGHFDVHLDGRDYPMQPGSILAAGMGEEHGVFDPTETFEGVGFATQLEGQKRDGHLWRDVHGAPVRTRSGTDTELSASLDP